MKQLVLGMRQSRYILDSKHLIFFILRFCAVLIFSFIIFGSGLSLFFNRNIGPTYVEGIRALNKIHNYLPAIIFITAFIQAIMLCFVVLLLALLWSHSVAGPIFRFRRNLRNIYEGKFSKEPLAFRNNDQLHFLAQSFSKIILSQKDKSARALTLLVPAQKILDESKRYSNTESDKRILNSKIQSLKKIYLSIKNIYFTQSADE